VSKLIYFWLILLLTGCGSDGDGSSSPEAPQEEVSMEVLTDRPDVVWGFDFLPDDKLIFTQRNGGIFILDLKTLQVSTVSGTPTPLAVGEGGLLDLEIHPNFTNNKLIYYCYTQQSLLGRAMAVDRGVLQDGTLVNVETIFRSNRANGASIHFGCRIEFESNNKFFLSLGEQNEPSQSQDPASHLGKILRLNDDGTNLEVWSSGHRNVQGLTIHPETGDLFSTEHGPTGGDELNLIKQGSNYGWPLVTRGMPAGALGQSAPGYVDPLNSWTPAIAPSGITFWKGDLYIATLRGQHIRRLSMDGTIVRNEEQLFEGQNTRFRNLRVGNDELLYFSTDDGKIGRIR
jgi:glucose/arabinose dehydrogenase